MDAEIQARLQKMADEDPLGREAVALLPYLTVFSDMFDGSAVVAVVKEEAETGPSRLLKVLKTWGFIDQPDKDHYRLIPNLADVVPPLSHCFERHFDYYRTRHMRVEPDRYERISAAWSNIAAALTWGFQHRSEHAVELALVLHPYMTTRVPLPEWKDLIQQALQVVRSQSVFNQAQVMKALGDAAFFEDDFISARQHYDEALHLYDTLPRDEFLWIRDGFFDEYLKQMCPDGEAASAYRRSYRSHTPRDIFHLFTLYDAIITAMKQKNIQDVKHLAMQILAFCRWGEDNDERGFDRHKFLLMCGEWSQSRQELESTRYFYSHVLGMSLGNLGQLTVLWKWGQLETTIGDAAAGQALRDLVLYTLTTMMDDQQDAIAAEAETILQKRLQMQYLQYMLLRDKLLNEI